MLYDYEVNYPQTVEEIVRESRKPAVGIDERGVFFFANKAFERAYGWSESDLIGKLITTIMPSHMRDAHNLGFSRFLVTEQARILGKRLMLPVLCKDGELREAEHYILAEKKDGAWRFAAIVRQRRS